MAIPTAAAAEVMPPGPDDAERDALAVLASVNPLGPATLARLVDRAGSARAVVDLARADRGRQLAALLATEDGGSAVPSALVAAIVDAARGSGEILRGIEQAGLSIVVLADAGYPARLRAIALPPHVLFVAGDPAVLSAHRAVAVVGTRRPTEAGRRIAARAAAALVAQDAIVVSGLALGIDGAAHAGTIAAGGRTVAVIGGGHRELSPRAHRALAGEIIATGGAVVSEHPPFSVPSRWTFPRRNRVIAGLAEAVVVVEAPARSGALITAAWAMEEGRGCFVVPAGIDAVAAAGCLALLREFPNEARIVAGIPELLEDLGLAGAPVRDRARGSAPPRRASARGQPRGPSIPAVLAALGSAERAVATGLLEGHETADALVATVGLPIGAILGALTLLQRRGLVAAAYGRYRPHGPLAGGATAPRRRRTA